MLGMKLGIGVLMLRSCFPFDFALLVKKAMGQFLGRRNWQKSESHEGKGTQGREGGAHHALEREEPGSHVSSWEEQWAVI